MKVLEIKYKCQHPSCIVNCRDGVISIDEEAFKELKSFHGEENLFRSPKGFCRLGFNQTYKVIKMQEDTGAEAGVEGALDAGADPIAILSAEHQVALKVLATIEEQMKRRDSDALWVSTSELENTIMLHSIRKEEDVLFPLLPDILPHADGLISIVKEDHRELVTLLHSFRTGIAEGEILDGLGLSILVNLRTHIRKEDNEFFKLIDKQLTGEHRKALLEGFARAEETFVPIVADEKSKEEARQSALARNRGKFNDEIADAIEEARASAGGCCH